MADKIITIAYLIGLLESDGTFLLSLNREAGESLVPKIKFTQKSNTNLIHLISEFYKKYDITYSIENNTFKLDGSPNTRTPTITIYGFENVKKLFDLIESANLPFIFAGVKQRDFLIFKKVLENDLTIAQKIGLKKSLHKENQDEPDFNYPQSIPREVFEKNRGLHVNASYEAAREILGTIDLQYSQHCSDLVQRMNNRSLEVDPDWVCGFVDGDGHLSVHISAGRGKYPLEFRPVCKLTTECRSKLTLVIIRYLLGSTVSIFDGLSKTTGEVTSVHVKFTNEANIRRLFSILGNPAFVGDLRALQQNLVTTYLQLLETNQLFIETELRNELIRQIFYISSKSKKGPKRRGTVEEFTRISNRWI